MVRQVDRERQREHVPICRPRRRQRLGRPRQGGERDRRAIADSIRTSPSRAGPVSTGATIRPSTNNTRASSRAYARRGCRRARRRRIEPARPRPCASAVAAEGPFRARAVELAKREGPFRALKAASRSQWDGGFGPHAGASGVDRRKRAFRPIATYRRRSVMSALRRFETSLARLECPKSGPSRLSARSSGLAAASRVA